MLRACVSMVETFAFSFQCQTFLVKLGTYPYFVIFSIIHL